MPHGLWNIVGVFGGSQGGHHLGIPAAGLEVWKAFTPQKRDHFFQGPGDRLPTDPGIGMIGMVLKKHLHGRPGILPSVSRFNRMSSQQIQETTCKHGGSRDTHHDGGNASLCGEKRCGKAG